MAVLRTLVEIVVAAFNAIYSAQQLALYTCWTSLLVLLNRSLSQQWWIQSSSELPVAVLCSLNLAAMVQVTMMRSKATKKVLYVEAGKDFVDLLLSFLVLPVGSVVARLSGKTGVPDIDASLGAITSILKSVGKLGARHLNVAEGSLVRPTVSVHSRECVGEPAEKLLGICLDSQPGSVETFYRCDNCWLMSRDEGKCPECRHYGAMNKFTVPGIVPTSGPGIAKDFPYIVTDDLTITPSSADTCFNLLRSMNVLSVEDLESSSIQVGPQQALKLLAASFTSRTALTDAFVVPDAVEPGSGHDSVAI